MGNFVRFPLLSRISTWEISNLHVDIFYFPRGRHSFPPKFYLIPPKNFFFPTWKIKILHVKISKYPRGESVSPPDIAPYRYVVGLNYCETDDFCNSLYIMRQPCAMRRLLTFATVSQEDSLFFREDVTDRGLALFWRVG